MDHERVYSFLHPVCAAATCAPGIEEIAGNAAQYEQLPPINVSPSDWPWWRGPTETHRCSRRMSRSRGARRKTSSGTPMYRGVGILRRSPGAAAFFLPRPTTNTRCNPSWPTIAILENNCGKPSPTAATSWPRVIDITHTPRPLQPATANDCFRCSFTMAGYG